MTILYRLFVVLIIALFLCIGAVTATAAVFFGPTHYQSVLDIPSGFYSGTPSIEDFEDGSLDFGITADRGEIYFGQPVHDNADSVDADDGDIDGSGLWGTSYYVSVGGNITFTFTSPVTAAGIVWTDGLGLVTFEAFGEGSVSLGTIGPVAIAGSGNMGDTEEDSFFGVQDFSGITSIKLSNESHGMEVDHVQFGNAVPIPSALWLLGSGLIGIVGIRRKFKK